MTTEAAKGDAGRPGLPNRGFRLHGRDDLTSVSRGADASGRVDCQPDVADIGQRGTAAVDAHADADVEIAGPLPLADGSLRGDGRVDGCARPLEDGEELVGARVDLSAARAQHGRPQDTPDVVQQVAVAVAQSTEQGCGRLDVGHQ